jgi:hypothetical protein
MAEIPASVKKIIFPLAYYMGKMIGNHRRFSDAPDAIKST